MTAEEFALKMNEISDSDDLEERHVDADALMCDLLRELGYGDGVEIFMNMYKWYA